MMWSSTDKYINEVIELKKEAINTRYEFESSYKESIPATQFYASQKTDTVLDSRSGQVKFEHADSRASNLNFDFDFKESNFDELKNIMIFENMEKRMKKTIKVESEQGIKSKTDAINDTEIIPNVDKTINEQPMEKMMEDDYQEETILNLEDEIIKMNYDIDYGADLAIISENEKIKEENKELIKNNDGVTDFGRTNAKDIGVMYDAMEKMNYLRDMKDDFSLSVSDFNLIPKK